LRERREDIPPLVEHFLTLRGLGSERLAPATIRVLAEHPYPGNIRELENLLERGLILAGDAPLSPEHFPSLLGTQPEVVGDLPEIPNEGVSLEDLERRYILSALQKTEGNKSRAAQLLGMTRRTLYSRMEKHGIPV
jgi:DNA-binding NtrC family response regulator